MTLHYIIIKNAQTGDEFKRQGPFVERVALECLASIRSSLKPGTYTAATEAA